MNAGSSEHKLSDWLVSVIIAYDRGHNIPSKNQICTPMATIQVSCLWNKEDPNQRVKRDRNTHSALYYPLWEETEGHPGTDLSGKFMTEFMTHLRVVRPLLR